MRFKTYTYSSLNWIYESWYKDGVKHVPSNISTYLTPLALAIWIIDDGRRVGKGLKFRTNSFTYSDCQLLRNVLFSRYSLRTSVQSAGVNNQYVIYVFVESMPLLKEIVKPYMVSRMLYKLV